MLRSCTAYGTHLLLLQMPLIPHTPRDGGGVGRRQHVGRRSGGRVGGVVRDVVGRLSRPRPHLVVARPHTVYAELLQTGRHEGALALDGHHVDLSIAVQGLAEAGGLNRLRLVILSHHLCSLCLSGGAVVGAQPTAGLLSDEACVDATLAHQRPVAARLHDAPLLHDEDLVSVAHRHEPVGDDDAGAGGLLHGAVQRLLHQRLALCIQRTGCLVQDQQLGVAHQCPRQSDALPLAPRQQLVGDHGLVAAGKGGDEGVGVGHAGRRLHVIDGQPLLLQAVQDVVGDGHT
mmetsp:Transcript_2825/g.8292  ORF Transcript_2825/g.8292 Transcript_2825/m.8292 type:complete len:288 (-) Transcript_2825:1939-2802(-)